MIDIKHLVKNTDRYEKELQIRNLETGKAIELVNTYESKNKLQQEVDSLRSQKNQFNDIVVKLSGEEKQTAINQMRELGAILKAKEAELKDLETTYSTLLYEIPNLTWDGIPVGKTDEDNVETAVFGQKKEYSFTPKHYYQLPTFVRDYAGEKGVKAVGSRGWYMRGELARFQRVLFSWVLEKLEQKGFEYVIPPIMVNEKVMEGTGFFPNSKNDFYSVNPGEDDLFLVGSSEPSLMFLHANEIVNLHKPKLFTAWTDCFRREAGSHGKDTQGGIRVHQFPKIEMVALCESNNSSEVFDLLTGIFTEIISDLGLHFHYLEVCTGDQPMKNTRMIDIEAWFPAQEKFREVCSSSNCTDYQTRNLNIKYIDENGDEALAHSLNCTGITNRTLFAIMEQYQNADGSVNIPEPLKNRFGKDLLE